MSPEALIMLWMYAWGGGATYSMLKAFEEIMGSPAPRGMIPLLMVFWPLTVPTMIISAWLLND